ncbi:putative leucine-rich repeat receptor-like serine/threonine-protein kinase At2g24130 [Phragmites australis]|uniref:putative leucine-rich repeat receptor-like serine/threonine-protein kinase At2g24130 n=1 Tax=Phragmites australis TaxID=29695 RepID=UPI002D7A0954|nr:putative leucine-rich repeat receptor-like serine/threonine-protein kinase At2g24130 [Phragmites australis]
MEVAPISAAVVFTFLLFFLPHAPIPTLSAGWSDDRSALLSFKSGVSSDPEGALDSWGSADVCNWTGVACDMATKRVVKLILRDQKLSGEVSPALGNLSHLNILSLSGNLFTGRVPSELGNLFRLNLLEISANSFAGEVPPELGDLSSLNFLDLSANFFTGEVPPELGNLSRLKQLSIGNNGLEGPIPVELTHIRNLIYLNLGENNLSGHIPEAIFRNLSSLQYIDLSSNSLDGKIPIRGDCPLPDLMFLVLWSNNLVGGIPRSISNSTKLKWLLLESNFLTGELPSDMFSNMRDMELLYLSYNYLESPENNTNLEPFFASLANCTNLKELGIAGNGIAGTIPPLVGRLSPGVKQLYLEYNKIFGPIPANLSDLTNLTALNLSHNFLNGSIPPGIVGMQRLERVYLSNNLLTGEVPPSLGAIPRLGLIDLSHNRLNGSIPATLFNLTQLRVLVLRDNRLSGVIPPSLAQCVNLQDFDLSHNALQGKIPADLSRLSGLLYLNLSGNLLEGPIPATISKMMMLQVLNLSSNRLSGTIPPQLGSCVALEYLNVSGNALEGGLPDTVVALPFLQILDVSYNGLTGALPLSLETAASLRRVNFSYNGFSGEVPGTGAFASFPADAFLGDTGLCGSVAGLARCGGARHRVLCDRRVVITVVGFTLAIIGVVACRAAATADVRRDARRSMLLTDADEPTKRDHPRVSHRELSEATRGFEQSSLIGAGRFGRVYEGTLRDGTRVAVKVLDPKSGGEVSRSFKRECQVLRRTRHRNLVRVVTVCSQPDFHALVLPLMPNGSLESRLYPHDGRPGRGLNLAQLVAIAGDVAEGLAYLHHYAPVRVVHCDLKPSNVLLDDDMTAVIADFGIAQLLKDVGDSDFGSDDRSNSITGLLKGSVGYIAPEYGLGGHPSTQGDVYSFGVMLLQLITGKRPTDVIFHEGLTLHDWIKRHYPYDVGAIVARSWLTDAAAAVADERIMADVMVELIDLGLVCTQHSPTARPTMVEVCHEIALLKENLAKHRGAASVTMTASERAKAGGRYEQVPKKMTVSSPSPHDPVATATATASPRRPLPVPSPSSPSPNPEFSGRLPRGHSGSRQPPKSLFFPAASAHRDHLDLSFSRSPDPASGASACDPGCGWGPRLGRCLQQEELSDDALQQELYAARIPADLKGKSPLLPPPPAMRQQRSSVVAVPPHSSFNARDAPMHLEPPAALDVGPSGSHAAKASDGMDDSLGWVKVKSRFWRRSVNAKNSRRQPPASSSGLNAMAILSLFKKKSSGRCFRCLASDHKFADCRDPPRCILRSASGHRSSWCPSKKKPARHRAARTASWRHIEPMRKAPIQQAPALPLNSVAFRPLPRRLENHIPGVAHHHPEPVRRCIPFSKSTECSERSLMWHVAGPTQHRSQRVDDRVFYHNQRRRGDQGRIHRVTGWARAQKKRN